MSDKLEKFNERVWNWFCIAAAPCLFAAMIALLTWGIVGLSCWLRDPCGENCQKEHTENVQALERDKRALQERLDESDVRASENARQWAACEEHKSRWHTGGQ